MITLDIAILSLFLLITLAVGMSHGRQVKSIKDFALGGKNFSTITLAAAIIATYASGGGFFIDIGNTYTQGLYYIMAVMVGTPLGMWFNTRLAMRMREFMHHVSVAEAMGSLLGSKRALYVKIVSMCVNLCVLNNITYT